MVSALILLAATPLPPPPQIVLGFGAIPESRNGPLLHYPQVVVPAARWTCRARLSGGETVEIAGTADRIEPDASQSPVPKWPPFTIVRVVRGEGHSFAGTYLATYSPNVATIYGFRLASGGWAYELTLRLNEFARPGVIQITRLEADHWVEFGNGTCTGSYLPESEPAS